MKPLFALFVLLITSALHAQTHDQTPRPILEQCPCSAEDVRKAWAKPWLIPNRGQAIKVKCDHRAYIFNVRAGSRHLGVRLNWNQELPGNATIVSAGEEFLMVELMSGERTKYTFATNAWTNWPPPNPRDE